MTVADYIKAAQTEFAAYGFTKIPLTESDLRLMFDLGVPAHLVYGIGCDVNAGVTLGTAIRTNFRAREANSVAEPEKTGVRTVDVTPTWSGLIPVFRVIVEDGTTEAGEAIWKEITRMAELADAYAAARKEGKI